MWKESQSKPADNSSTPPGSRSNLGGSAEHGPGSRRFRWWVAAAAAAVLLISLIIIGQPDGDLLEARVRKILEPIRREERNEKGIYQLAARLEDMPQPLPKLSQWIRDEDPDREDPDPEELLELGDEAGLIVLRLLADDRSPAVRAGLCGVAIQFENIDPLPVLTNLIATDLEALVRGAAVSAAVEYDADRAAEAVLRAVAAESDDSVLAVVIQALPKLGRERALGPLLAELNIFDVNTSYRRVWAADALGELGGEEAIAALRQTLDAKDEQLSVASARALAKLRDRESLPRLIARLETQVSAMAAARQTNAPSSRYTPIYLDAEFVTGIGEFGDPIAVPVLLQAVELSSQQAWHVRPVFEALGKIGDERALEPLVGALKGYVDRGSRKIVIDAIAGITSSNTFPALLGIMTNYSDSAGDVVEAMSRLRGSQATEQLREILNLSTGRAREAAAQALGMSGHPAALPVLLEAIDSNDDEARKAAAEALGMIADPQAIPALITALKDSSSDVRQEAAWALGRIGEAAGTPALIAALADAEFAVRFAAAFALAGIQDASAVAPLQPLLKDKERRVQIAAACSLAFHNSDAGFETLKSNLRLRVEDWHRFAAIVGLLRLNTSAAREALEQAPADLKYPQLQRLREVGLKVGPAPALMSLLREGTDEQRHYAARVLPFFCDPATVAPLRDAANDTSAEVRSAARVGAVQVERQLAARQTSEP